MCGGDVFAGVAGCLVEEAVVVVGHSIRAAHLQTVQYSTVQVESGYCGFHINPISEGGGTLCPPLRNIALNQVIWGPGPPKLIDFS